MEKPVLIDVRYATNTLANSLSAFLSAVDHFAATDILAEGLFHVEHWGSTTYKMFYMVPPYDSDYQLIKTAGGYQKWQAALEDRLPSPDMLGDIWYEFGKRTSLQRIWLVCDIEEEEWPLFEDMIRTSCRGAEDSMTFILPKFKKNPAIEWDICSRDPASRIRLSSNRPFIKEVWDHLTGKRVLDLETGGDFTLRKLL